MTHKIETERKFLVTNNSFKDLAFAKIHVWQGYLSCRKGVTVRVRICEKTSLKNCSQTSNNNSKYSPDTLESIIEKCFLTIKGSSKSNLISRNEFEISIPKSDAKMLFSLCEGVIIDKTRWLVAYGKHTFEVDEFHRENAPLIVAEVELDSEEEAFEHPSFLGEEVTLDRRYSNSALSCIPYSLWL